MAQEQHTREQHMWRYRQQLEKTFERLNTWLHSLGEPFVAEWTRYAKRLADRAVGGDILEGLASPLAFPSVPLIWWTAETAGFEDLAACEELSYGALAGYFAIRIQDDVLDDHAPTPPLLLANVLWEEYHRILRAHAEPGHLFWTLWEDWYQRFSGTTLWEIRNHRGVRRPFSSTDLDRLGEKFLPAAGPASLVAFLAGRPDLVRWIPVIVQHLGCGLQLVNDHRGLMHDFATGNYTAVITDVLLGVPRLRELEQALFPERVARALPLERNLDRARAYLEAACDAARSAGFAGVADYAAELQEVIERERARIAGARTPEGAAEGGTGS